MIKFLKSQKFQWPLFAALWLTTLALGVIGFAHYAAMHATESSFLDQLYLTLQLIPMNSGAVTPPLPFELELARFLMPILTAATAIKAILDIFYTQFQMVRLGWLKGHIIICGLSRKGLLLTRSFRSLGKAVVVIEQDEDNEAIASCREQGAVVVIGDATDTYLLERAGVRRARALFAVCDADEVNAEIAVRARDLVQARPGGFLTCLVHVTDPKLCTLLKENENSLGENSFQMELFNVYEEGARRMMQEYPAWKADAVSQKKPPHILIVGLGRMGENILIHAARNWQNPHYDPNRLLRVSIIDRHANLKVETLSLHFPQLAKACKIEPLQMEIASPGFERGEFLFDKHKRPCLDAIYIAVDDDSLGLHAGLTLLRQMPSNGTPVVVRMAEEKGLARLLGDKLHPMPAYTNLHAFGLLDHTCTPGLLNDTPRDLLARAAHEEYLRQQKLNSTSSLNGPAMRPWDELDEVYRLSYYRWVDNMQSLLKEIGYVIVPLVDWDAPAFEFTSVDVERMAKKEHQQWVEDNRREGWRHLPQRGEAAKTHPDLLEWEKLSGPEKDKNRSLVRRIPSFLGQAGYQVKQEPVNHP